MAHRTEPTGVAEPAAGRGSRSAGFWLPRWRRLQTRLVISHAVVGAIVTVLSLLSSHYVHRQADDRQARRAVITSEIAELYALAASASEEGFSYVLSADVGERVRFEDKVSAAERGCDAVASDDLSDAERDALREVSDDFRRLRLTGEAMFEAAERTHALRPLGYADYEASVDGTWAAVASLDAVAREQTAEGRRWTSRTSDGLSMAGGLLAFTVAVVLGIALGRRLGRPLAALRDAAVAFGEGRTDVVPVRSDDEIGDVVSAFETMRERVRDNHRTLVATEKMAAIGRLTAGIAHEMNSPLAALRLSVEELGDLVTEYRESIAAAGTSGADHRRICEEMGGALELADMASSRAVDFVRSIRSQTRLGHGTKAERFDVMAVVEDAVSLVRHAARAAGCELSVVAPTDRPEHLSGNASALAHAVTNLLQNAIDATSEAGGGEIEVAVEASRDVVSIRVADTGPGIPPEVLPRIFEALYTTKGYGHGTGLGLAIVKEAVEETFGGRVDVDTIVGQGTRFTMRIPRLGTHVAPQASAWTQSWAHGSGG